MKKIIRWIKKHIRPFTKVDDLLIREQKVNRNNLQEESSRLKKKTFLGIKFSFKF